MSRPTATGLEGLAHGLEALASPLRLRLLRRLAQPAFLPDLRREFDFTRQALRRHLAALEETGLVRATPGRRGALPATRYATDPAGVFAFKENVFQFAVPAVATSAQPLPTRTGGRGDAGGFPGPRGFLLVHGDRPGRWYPLAGSRRWMIGREDRADVSLSYDPFASLRHAHVARDGASWHVIDLHATNGTFVNFARLEPGEAAPLAHGDVLTIGCSHLVFRDGS